MEKKNARRVGVVVVVKTGLAYGVLQQGARVVWKGPERVSPAREAREAAARADANAELTRRGWRRL